MCDCVKEIEKKSEQSIQEQTPKALISKVEFVDRSFVFDKKVPRLATHSTVEYRHQFTKANGELSKPRTKKVMLLHSFCPFCGEKYEKDKK